MSGPAEPVFPVDGTENVAAARGVRAFGHPRAALRAIPRFPLGTADVEAMRLAFGAGSSAHPFAIGGTYPVAEGGIPARQG